MLRVSIKNNFCAWTLAVTVLLIVVETFLALWVYLIEFTTFMLGFFMFNGYSTVKRVFLPRIYY